MTRDILVLWRWSEALECEGHAGTFASVGGQMKAVRKGDRLFICATSAGELYLLGLLQVRKVVKERSRRLRVLLGGYRAECRNLSGTFKVLPLGNRKWRLRFENTDSPRLDPHVALALQVRSHRFLSSASAELLTELLGEDVAAAERERRFLEGERRAARTIRQVRSAALRVEAKRRWGPRCYCCGFSFEEFYGPAGRSVAIIHHLDQLGGPDGRARETTVEDVRVVCANCHCIIHCEDRPSLADLDKLRQQLGRRWTGWSSRGVRAR